MSHVFVNIGLSLDGCMAPDGMAMGKPGYNNWAAKWGALMTGVVRRLFEHLREPAPRFCIDKVLDDATATHQRCVRR